MSAALAITPVRRSPLSQRHRALGARFGERGEWPATYGDLQRERRALRERVGLVDAGPLDKIAIAGDLPARSALPAMRAGAITTGEVDGRAARLWCLADDEALLIAPGVDAHSSDALLATIETNGGSATDVSSAYAMLQLIGPRARDVLEELYPEDVSEEAFPDRAIGFGPLANVAVTIARLDHGGVPGFAILVERDHAEHIWDALLTIGARHGIEPVGGAALAED